MAVAHVNPEVLRWAVERADVTSADLGKALRKTETAVEGWLDGSSMLTFRQAQDLAKRLRVPFGYLFLSEPPHEELPIADFRRGSDVDRVRPSVDLRDTIAETLRKQDWYRDFRLDNNEEPLKVVGLFSIDSRTADVAESIASTLDFAVKVRSETQNDRFLRAFVDQVEAQGILVVRNGVVQQDTNRALNVEEFRGFSLVDPMAPVIFINNTDSASVKIFTLAHELAHIWIGQGGISDADPTVTSNGTSDVETFCNAVAAELLLPWSQVATSWRQRKTAMSERVRSVSREFNVSTVMVARQLWTHSAISREDFFGFYEQERDNWTATRQQSSGGNYYWNVSVRNSRLLTRALLRSVDAWKTSMLEASRLLGRVKPANFKELKKSLGML
ncbi:MAG: ImmA/IrrE family metallo-endopeptidase [Acidimicrobiaceae bacterium]|nr:ImmA/IrrE family metallo-endopeptidase [Acidimicrobiaceae bacterium]